MPACSVRETLRPGAHLFERRVVLKGVRGRRRGRCSFPRLGEKKSCGAKNLRRAESLVPD
jgi:hypothetical protein